MSDDVFAADWLALREPADHEARPGSLVAALADWWTAAERTGILDLGCGTGSNLRYLAPRLTAAAGAGYPQRWTLLDHDASLLARVSVPGLPAGAVSLAPVHGDLAREGLALVADADLVTASALLDLVSAAWADRLVERCVDAGAAALFALCYDGEIRWATPDPGDALVREAVNAHQRREKGLGGALGPDAADHVARSFSDAGYATRVEASPWHLDGAHTDLARALVDGWRAAAVEQRPDARDTIEGWARRRGHAIASGEFRVAVGHLDVLALPPV